MTNKEKYRALCIKMHIIPLFSQAWWLDATAGEDNWEVALVAKGDEIVAALPYVVRKRYGLVIIGQPMLTQSLGPWLRDFGGKSAKKLEQQKEWMEGLIGQLPKFSHYSQNWSWQNSNWLPFYWNDFKQTTRYTYVLHDLTDLDEVWKNFRENIRTDIKKATNRYNLKVRDDLSFSDFFCLNRKTFERQGIALPYSEEFANGLDSICSKNNARKIFIAEDEQGRYHAGVYIVWDKNSAYYLMGGGDPSLRGSGATSLCMWEAIKFAATVTLRFDFEGSMIEPVERFFRAFGAVQTPYFAVSKTPSRLVKTAFFLKELTSDK